MHKVTTILKTNIGNVEGYLDESGSLFILNPPKIENRKLAHFLPTPSQRSKDDVEQNPNNYLKVEEPSEFAGIWEVSGPNVGNGDALRTYPFMFKRVSPPSEGS
ncbi:hypothetical protein HJ202_19185 [Vibrio parahaemolyticus]|uniref:hypothetical protein n=1 Tax=Vibrio harveyi group TaxID=717610 RepID=UPI00084A6B1F|nr:MULTISPECIES: hypothetical protein [Vibrio harveyi group]HCZ9285095.1 hypothetical protein [Vibrio alginolyticus]EJO3863069.1 hypothetical protein [Vibrio parahaemolyticus]EJR4296047.1 hypothetical protein [Vibrio parahaemolyticus]MBE3722452.1 hypothetical protein [Vibrio parahaemolyticus]MCR9845900.1 hypothetical protein [Vibrio antiquarius]